MYGWRGRIGVVLPADNTVLEPDFYRFLPDGVSAHTLRLQKAPRPDMPAQAVTLANAFTYTRVNVVGYMCAASSFMLGVDGNRELVERLSAATGGLPAFTASTAMVDALRAVGARRVAVLAPHPDDIAARLTGYLADCGIEVVTLDAMNLSVDAINDSAPGQIYRRARQVALNDADALFIAATNFRALDVIEPLERDLCRPVITSNQAALWVGLRLLRVREPQPRLGALFAQGQ